MFADGKDDITGVKGYNAALKQQQETRLKEQELAQKKLETTKFMGDQTLTGDAYLKSLPADQSAAVKMAGDGRMLPGTLNQLARKNPDFIDAVAKYDPSFDGTKVDAYDKAMKAFTSGPEAASINAGATAIQTLRDLYDNTTAASLNPYSEAGKKRQADVETAAIELAKFQAGGKQPGQDDIRAARELLNPTVPLTGGIAPNPVNRRAAIKEQMSLLQNKINSYEQQWIDAAPSPRYQAPMPNMSNAARIDSAYVLNDGKYTVPRGSVSMTDPKTKHQIFTFDGKKYYDASNGQPFNPTTPGAK
jgi:hypothetical protein